MISFALAREIYGNSPWMIDSVSFSSLFNILKDFRNGVSLSFDKDDKCNSVFVYNIESKIKLTFDEFQLRNTDDDDDVISIISLNGIITKNGANSTNGMKRLSEQMNRMTADSRVKGHILLTDSGGGASNAVIFMTDSIQKSQDAGKPVVQLVEKGGLNASAAYYIGSYTNYILSESSENLIGSIGTMIELSGFPKNNTDESGRVHIRAYATESIEKNIEFEEALKGNLKPIINNILDPLNEKFLSDVKANRPSVGDAQLTGKIFRAKDVVGTLIDGIGNMEDAVNKVLTLGKLNENGVEPKNNININNKEKMDLNKFKQEHPDLYKSVFAAGVAEERDRTGAWLAHAQTDLKAVKKGISEGKDVSKTQREDFLVKAASLSHLQNLQNDTEEDIKTPEAIAKAAKTAKEQEADDFYAKVDEKLKPIKSK